MSKIYRWPDPPCKYYEVFEGGRCKNSPPTVTLSFTADPLLVPTGGAATLSWSAGDGYPQADGVHCTASGAWSGNKPASGTQTTGPITASTTFSLTCANDGGGPTKSVTIAPYPPAVSLAADPGAVAPGAYSTLTWSSTNAASCTASGAWSGTKPTSGSQQIGPITALSSFVLTCEGGGRSAHQEQVVRLLPPVVSFTANPTSVASDGYATLAWSATHATECTASGSWSGARAISGSEQVGPITAPSSFDLICIGDGGPTFKSVMVMNEKTLGEPKNCVGNPCNPATGNKYEVEVDYRNGDGSLSFVRYYNSQSQRNVGLGPGWTHSFSANLAIMADKIWAYRPNAASLVFTGNGSGTWQGAADDRSRLEQNAAGYLLHLADGSKEAYNLQGRIVSATDRAGKTTAYQYNSGGMLESVTGPFGHRLAFTYANGALQAVTDPNGSNIHYSGNTAVTYQDGAAKRYHYEMTVTREDQVGPSSLLTGITDENGRRFAYFDYYQVPFEKVSTTEHAVTTNGAVQEHYHLYYDSETQTTVVDGLGMREVMTFDINLGVKNLVSKVNQSDGKRITQSFDANNNLTSRTDEEGRTTTYRYNAHNQRISQTQADGTPVARTTSYEYLSPTSDLQTLIESPSVYPGAKQAIVLAYDANQNLVSMVRRGFTPAGQAVSSTTTFTYNAIGQLIQIDGARGDIADITTLEYYNCATGGACGQLKKITNAAGQSIVYDSYDAHGRVTHLKNIYGLNTTLTYDLRGRLISVLELGLEGRSKTTHYTYDAAGQLTETRFPSGRKLFYTYDAAHYLTQVTDDLGNKVVYRYDVKGNRNHELIYDPNGTLVRDIQLSYDLRNRIAGINAGGSITQKVHDAIGNLLRTVDPNNNPRTYQYDALNRLVREVDALSGTVHYAYDVNDRLAQLTAANSAVTKFAYDDLGNLLEEQSPDRGVTRYGHDSAGNVTIVTDARGVAASYLYDAVNRPTSIDYPGTDEDVTYTYAPCGGPLCTVQDKSGLTKYYYGEFSELLLQEHTELNIKYSTYFGYDGEGRVLSLTYPGGRTVGYTRDAAGRITGVSATVNGATVPVVSNIARRADGRITAQAFGNGLVDTRSYDLQGRLTQQTLGNIETRNYTYDASGNLLTKDTGTISSYTYDAADRLLQDIFGSIPRNTFTYDANGNRLTATPENSSAIPYSYSPASNRLIQWGGNSITYDAAGNMLTNNTRRYTYNNAGKLYQVFDGNTLRATYTYNAFGQRTRKVVGTVATLYHYDPRGNLIAETRANGSSIRAYIWVDDVPVAQIDAGTPEKLFYIHTDRLNVPRVVTNATGMYVWRMEGNAFGDTMANFDPDGDEVATTMNLRFPGQYFDQESGLHYNWNRYYDPRTGRYMTSDPIGLGGGLNTYGYVGSVGKPLAPEFNTYLYAHANPLRFIDPMGLSSIVYNSGSGTIDVIDNNGQTVGSFPASNNAASNSAGPWPGGTYSFGYYVPHAGSGPNSPYGSNGNFVFNVPGRSGMGVHSGRANSCDLAGRCGPEYATEGCIRTIDDATDLLRRLHQGGDPLTAITVNR